MNTSFERCELTKVEWLTPPDLVKKLGEFDLDPCSPINAPFFHAKTNYTIEDNGLDKEWFGRVFCNPPYGKQMNLWLAKLKVVNLPDKISGGRHLSISEISCVFPPAHFRKGFIWFFENY